MAGTACAKIKSDQHRGTAAGEVSMPRAGRADLLVRELSRGAHLRAACGVLAETEHHHPDMAFGWGRATVSLQTKKIKGLHKNDFIMAAKIDRIAVQYGAQARKN
jgi:hypothetical protein